MENYLNIVFLTIYLMFVIFNIYVGVREKSLPAILCAVLWVIYLVKQVFEIITPFI